VRIVFKVIFFGEGGAGKTSIVQRAIKGTFNPNMKLTVGVDFAVRDVSLGDWHATLQFWDLGGQLRFRELVFTYFTGAHLAIAVFDLANRFSLLQLENMVKEFFLTQGSRPLIVIGNKMDLRAATPSYPSLIVAPEEGEAFAQKYDAVYCETSARTGEGVEDLMSKITEVLAAQYPEPPDPLEMFRRS
jgi:small GTP-binding protein